MSAVSALCLAACSNNNDAAPEADGANGDTASVASRIETTTAVPAEYFNAASEQGTVEVVSYDSRDYTQDSRPVTHKPAYP